MEKWEEIERRLQQLSKEIEDEISNSDDIRCKEYLYNASTYIDDAILKMQEAIRFKDVD